MQLKLRKPISKTMRLYTELRRQVTMDCSVCCLCEKRSQDLPSVDAFVEGYKSINGNV